MRKTTAAIILTLALLLSSLPLFKVEAQETKFIPVCSGTDDTSAFATFISAIGSNAGTITLPYKATSARCAVNNLTIPSNVTLNGNYGAIKVNTGQTLTILGLPSAPASKPLFYNALSGQGTVTFAGNSVVSTLSASWWSGGDFGQKVTAAKTALPSTGGFVDAKNLTGAQSLSGALSLDKSHVTYTFGNVNVSQGTNQVTIPSGTDDVSLIGRGVSFAQNDTGGTVFNYSGIGIGVVVGDSSAQVKYFLLQDIKLYDSNSAGSALKLVNPISTTLERPRIISPTGVVTGTGIEINGTNGGGSTYAGAVTIREPRINGFQKGVATSGGTSFASNHHRIVGGTISGNAQSGTTCVYFGNGDSLQVEGTDCEGYDTGLYAAAGTRNVVTNAIRFESIGSYLFDVASGSEGGYYHYLAPTGGSYRDLGTADSFIDPYHPINTKLVMGTTYSAGGVRSVVVGDTLLALNANDPSGKVTVNQNTGAGTSGFGVYSGGSPSVLMFNFTGFGFASMTGVNFADLGGQGNSTYTWCKDCAVNTAPPYTCAGSGSGAFAFKSNDVWKCPF